MTLVLISNQIENTMKKTYIVPEIEIIKISTMSVLAASLQSSDDEENTITDANKNDFSFNSNAFQGGLFDNDDE